MGAQMIFIAGGGTGGHIYPGVAIARALQSQKPDLKIHFVGTQLGLEGKIVPKEGFPLHFISVGKLNYAGGLGGKLKTLLAIPWAFIQSILLLIKYRPEFVLGVGGYASGPFVLMASVLGFKTAIWEPNAHPGMTNRWLSRFVNRSFVVFSEAQEMMKSKDISKVGLPVRQSLESVKPIPHESFNILIFGGSQGARAINRAFSEAVLKGGSWMDGVHVVHQTGALDFAEIHKKYEPYRKYIEPKEFLFDMDQRYAWADLVICRAGASTVAELAAVGLPAIMIPLPTAADDHQKKNAEVLATQNAGILIEQKDLSPERLIAEIQALKSDRDRLNLMRNNVRRFNVPESSTKIAKEIFELCSPT
jgi:UDP-N-acetylglucosamine--N-acetylmuramyl-(pentapeptide) pyrophosphoryl-undecaprenol N-acetylglucosamine transferase